MSLSAFQVILVMPAFYFGYVSEELSYRVGVQTVNEQSALAAAMQGTLHGRVFRVDLLV